MLGAVLVGHAKDWIRNDRPQGDCTHPDAIGFGMPSGHAQTAGALLICALTLVYFLRIPERVKEMVSGLLVALSFLVPVARVAVGAHSVPQVIVGFTIGVLMSLGGAVCIGLYVRHAHIADKEIGGKENAQKQH